MYFLLKCGKIQGVLKNPRKNPRTSGKNPRTQDWIEKPSVKNATQQSNKPAGPRRRANKLSAAVALRPSKIGGGGAHKFSAARTDRPGKRSRPIFIVGHTVTTVYYESIWLDPFANITFAISTVKNIYRPTFNLSYWMTCTRLRLNSRNRSASGASPVTSTGAPPLDPAGGLPFLRPL